MTEQTMKMAKRQRQAYELAMGGQPVMLITGEAGTGKTFTVHEIIKGMSRKFGATRESSITMVAPTGVAANQMSCMGMSGMTIHSLLGMTGDDNDLSPEDVWKKIDPDIPGNLGKPGVRYKIGLLKYTRVLFLDEISMVGRIRWDQMEYVMRMTHDRMKPWGGVQVLISGDFQQIPPIITDNKNDNGKRQMNLHGEVAQGPAKDGLLVDYPPFLRNLKVVLLNENQRQKGDLVMRYVLACMRRGGEWLDDPFVWDCLNNLRVPLKYRKLPNDKMAMPEIYTHKKPVEEKNFSYLKEELEGPWLAIASKDVCMSTADFHRKSMDAELERSVGAQKRLRLREGAMVLWVKNDPLGTKLVNGSRGVVTHIEFPEKLRKEAEETDKPVSMLVDLSKGDKLPLILAEFETDAKTGDTVEVKLEPYRFEVKYKTDGGKPRYVREALPVVVAKAMTVHKAQGQTINCGIVAEMHKAWEPGQAYTALTRFTHFQGLELQGAFGPSAVKNEPRVAAFYARYEDAEDRAALLQLKKDAHEIGVFKPVMKEEYADYKPEGHILTISSRQEAERLTKKMRMQDGGAAAAGEEEEAEEDRPRSVVGVLSNPKYTDYEKFEDKMRRTMEALERNREPLEKFVCCNVLNEGTSRMLRKFCKKEGVELEIVPKQSAKPKKWTLDEESSEEEEEEEDEMAVLRATEKMLLKRVNKLAVFEIKGKAPFTPEDFIEEAEKQGKKILKYRIKLK